MMHDRKVYRSRVQDYGSLHTLQLSALICGANERANCMVPTSQCHNLANANKILATSIMVGASMYGMRMHVRTRGLVRDECTERRSTRDDGHTGVWTLLGTRYIIQLDWRLFRIYDESGWNHH